MDKETAEEIIRENRIRPDMTYKTICLTIEDTVLSLEDGTELLDDFDLWKTFDSNLKNHDRILV